MTESLLNWLDHRTGFRKLLGVMLLEDIPGGARWRYVWGSTLVFVFSLQLITGILLMTGYSPSDTSAWASVHYIQYQMDFGWLIRGLHHFGSQTMMVLIALHMLQVVIAGAHLPPREVNWWLGLALLGVTFGLGLTGYLLPWDQKGYYATRVATNIAGMTPGGAGPSLQRLLVGGEEYGNHTLTRFYAMHVAVLPLTLIALMVAHIAVFRRHGVTHPPRAVGEEMFWPGQAFRDLVACLVVFGVMIGLVIYGHGLPIDGFQPDGLYDEWAHAGQKGLGANLDAPADRGTPDYPARPEWYFLFLFQLLKYFHGEQEIIGTFVIPNAAMALLFILPLLGFGAMRKFGHFFGILVMATLLGGAALLIAMAVIDDSPDLLEKIGNKDEKKLENARAFEHSVKNAEHLAHRAVNLAMAGVPQEGALLLLRNDPLTRGKAVFEMHCATCHAFTASEADKKNGIVDLSRSKDRKASDLGDWGTAAWVHGLLKNPSDPHYFGGMEQLTGMKKWRKGVERERKKMDAKDIAAQEADFDLIAQLLATTRDGRPNKQGLEAFQRQNCTSCHTFGDEKGDETAPDLTNYASADWIRGMITAPAHKSRFRVAYDGENLKGLMPAFANLENPGALQALRERNSGLPDNLVVNLSETDREAVIRFMLRDYRVVFGGTTISAAPK